MCYYRNESNHVAVHNGYNNLAQTSFSNGSLYKYLVENHSEYTKVVPVHWLEQEQPDANVQLLISIILLFICIPGNFSQVLVFIAYFRYFQFTRMQ